MGFETPWGAYQFDLACLAVGRKTQKDFEEGRNPFKTDSDKPTQFRDPRQFKKARKIKVKADGTW
jgi:hypothetical protein